MSYKTRQNPMSLLGLNIPYLKMLFLLSFLFISFGNQAQVHELAGTPLTVNQLECKQKIPGYALASKSNDKKGVFRKIVHTYKKTKALIQKSLKKKRSAPSNRFFAIFNGTIAVVLIILLALNPWAERTCTTTGGFFEFNPCVLIITLLFVILAPIFFTSLVIWALVELSRLSYKRNAKRSKRKKKKKSPENEKKQKPKILI